MKDTDLRTNEEFLCMTYRLCFLLLFPGIIILQVCTSIPLSSAVSGCHTRSVAYHIEKNFKKKRTPQNMFLAMERHCLSI